MKFNFTKKMLFVLISLVLVKAMNAQQFTPGNLLVYRVGDGTASLRSVGTYVFIDEYTPTGVFVQSVKLPGLASEVTGNNKRLVASGSAGSEGFLTRSVNGLGVYFTGYDADTGTTNVKATTAANNNRIIGFVDINKNVNTSHNLKNYSSANNIRSVVSSNGTDIWVSAATNGVAYATPGIDTAVYLGTANNIRCVNIFGGQLYLATGSGSTIRIGKVGTGLPKTSGQTVTALPGISLVKNNPYQFFMANLAGGTVLYYTDDSTGVHKYSLVNGTWQSNDSIFITENGGKGVRGLTAQVTGNTVEIYLTYVSSTVSGIAKVTDNSGYNASIATATTAGLVQANANTAFRGIAFAPTATPLPIELTNFYAVKNASYVTLNWNMQVNNTTTCLVEKSLNGKDFYTLYNMTVTQQDKYTYNDNEVVKNTVYYRLKVIEKNGTVSYSKIISVQAGNNIEALKVYPNPATDNLTIQHNAFKQATLQVTNHQGQVMQTVAIKESATTTSIPVKYLASGVYYINISTEGMIYQATWMKK